MKRAIKSFFIMVICFSLCMIPSVSSLAANGDTLEQLILKSKELFGITDDYKKFDNSISSMGNKQYYRLNWTSESPEKQISVTIGTDGIVTEYYNYESSIINPGKVLPNITREEGEKLANDFLAKVAPDTAGKIKIVEDSANSTNLTNYTFVRINNDIEYPSNSLNINLNGDGSKVQSYSRVWYDNMTFPSSSNAINKDSAISAFQDEMGLRLVYSPVYDKKHSMQGAMLSYQSKYNLMNTFIDALTGEKFETKNYFGYTANSRAEGGKGMAAADQSATLTPVEEAVVSEVKDIITKDEAEKIAREHKYTNIPTDYKLENFNLYKNETQGYFWSLYFSNQETSISVQVNGKTKELTGLSSYSPEDYDKKGEKYDRNQYLDKVNSLLSEIYPDKFKEVDIKEDYTVYEPDYLASYYFPRVVNNIPVTFDGINITYNPKTDKIVNLTLNWSNVNFPDNTPLALSRAYDILFDNAKYQMTYIPMINDKLEYPRVESNKLGYSLDMPFIIDGVTGELKNSNGQEYKVEKPLSYSDIDGHWAESYINKLASTGIGPDADTFRPDENITQADFLRFLYCYNYGNYNADEEEITRNLRYEGILKADEKLTNSQISREDSILYVMRALKYDKVAAIKKIFTCDFKDLNEINPDLVGSVCIGNGLGILKGTGEGYFNPKGLLSRAQGAVILYNMFEI